MVENMNDFLSILLIVITLGACILFAIRVFSRHHAAKIQMLESEYYQDDDATSDNTYDD